LEDHILREILSQPDVWRGTLARMFGNDSPIKAINALIGEGPVIFTGMGSSYYLSIAAAPMWRHYVGGRVRALSASNVITYPEICALGFAKGTVFGISRSGETFETRDAVRLLRQTHGWSSIGVTCHPSTAVLAESEGALVLDEAAEISRFTTRALTTTVLALQALAAIRARNSEFEDELRRLPDLADGLLTRYGALVNDKAAQGGYNRFVFLGQGPFLGFARELMLKTEEIVRAPAEVCETLEYLHGPKYAADSSTLVTVMLSDAGTQYQLDALAKIKGIGAKIAVVCEKATPDIAAGTDFVIELNSGLSDCGRMLLVMPLTQLFIYHRAIAVGQSAWIREMVYGDTIPNSEMKKSPQERHP
jgi:glutamine---fructose-6-phosphate transaminase (isomerizing)